MLVMRILWLIPALFGPNNSEEIDTAAEITNPELKPISPVLKWRIAELPDATSRPKAIGVGRSETANHPVLAKANLLHQ